MQNLRADVKELMQLLQQTELFAETDLEALETLAAAAELRACARGEILFNAGDRATGLYVVAEGRVLVSRLGRDGREQILHDFGPGELVGEVAMFSGGDFPAGAQAADASQVLFLSRDTFVRLAHDQPNLLLGLIAVLSRRLRHFVHLVDDLSLKEVDARLARILLEMAAGEIIFELPMSKAQLAARIGTIPETLSRCLKRLQNNGVIQVQGPKLELLKVRILQQLAGE